MKKVYLSLIASSLLFSETTVSYDLKQGWNLKSTPKNVNSSNNECNYEEIYTFDNEKGWNESPKSIKAGSGFWIKVKNNMNCKLVDLNTTIKETLDIKRGWNLIGFDIENRQNAYYFFDFEGFSEAFKYSNGWQRYSKNEFSDIEKNEGIWLYSTQNNKIPFAFSKEYNDKTRDSKLEFKVKSTEKIEINTSLISNKTGKNLILTNPTYGKLSSTNVKVGEKIEYTPPSRFIGLQDEIIGYKIEDKENLSPIEDSGNIVIKFPEFKKFEVEITDSPYEDVFEVRAQKTYDIKIKAIDKDGQIIKNSTFFLDIPKDKKDFFAKSENMVYSKDGEANFVYDSSLKDYVEIIGSYYDSKFTYGQVVTKAEFDDEVARITAENAKLTAEGKSSYYLLDIPKSQNLEIKLENGSFNFQIYTYSGDNQKIIKNIRVMTYDDKSTIQKISYPTSFSINPSDILSLEKGNIRQKVIFSAVDKYGNPVVKGNRIYAGAFSNKKREAKIINVDAYNPYKITIQSSDNKTNYQCLKKKDENCIIKPNDWLIVKDGGQANSQIFSWWEIDDVLVDSDSNLTETLLLKDKFIDTFKEAQFEKYKNSGLDINESWWQDLEVWVVDNKVINECTKGYSVASVVGSDGVVESLGNSLYGEFFTTEMGSIRGTLQFDEWMLDKPVYIFATARGVDDSGRVYRVGNMIEHNLSMSGLFGQKDIFIDATYKMNSETNMSVNGLLNLHPHKGSTWMSDEFSYVDFIDKVEPGFDKDTYSLDTSTKETKPDYTYTFFSGIPLPKKDIKIYAENTKEKNQTVTTECDGTYSVNFKIDNTNNTFGGDIYEERFCASKQDFSRVWWWEVDTNNACIEKISYNPKLGIDILQNSSIYVQYKLISDSSVGATFYSIDPNVNLGVSRLSNIKVSLTLIYKDGTEKSETNTLTNSIGFAIVNIDDIFTNNSQVLAKIYTKDNNGTLKYQLITQGFEIDESYKILYDYDRNGAFEKEYSLVCDKINNDRKDCSVAIIKANDLSNIPPK